MVRPKLGGRLSFADIRLVIGTRPEAIKLAPVARALAARGFAPMLVLTGQHALIAHEFGLGGFPVDPLDCAGEEDPHDHVRAVTAALLPRLGPEPDLVIVQGDTSSALGAALAAFTAGIPIAHVEAGLRTHDPASPWPEEEYRSAIDAGASLLFAATERTACNLQSERVPGEIFVTGNTGIDALVEAQAALPPPSLHDSAAKRLLVTCHRRESWGDGIRSVASALRGLAARGALIDVILHPNEHVANAMTASLGGVSGIELLEPCGHDQLLARMRDATLVLSDSGGIQEEAPALGIPLLVLRDKTERPEGIECGNALLVGTDRDVIVEQVTRLLDQPAALAAMGRRSLPYGDGRAAPRIAAIIERWLEARSGAAARAAPAAW